MEHEPRPSLDGVPMRRGGPGRVARAGRGQQAAAQLRASRAIEMRMSGASFVEIANRLGYANPNTARRACARALDRDSQAVQGLVDEYRSILLARCERLIRSLWPSALRGDKRAVRSVVQLLERECQLLGLDAPAQVVVSEVTRSALSDVVDDIERLNEARIEALKAEIQELGHEVIVLMGDEDETAS